MALSWTTFEHMLSFVTLLPKVVALAIKMNLTTDDRGEHLGGNVCTLPDIAGHPIMLRHPVELRSPVGEVSETSRSLVFCGEKAHRNRKSGHVSSWVDRDVNADQYGGGVRFSRAGFVAAFSGLPEDVDEAVVLVTASMLGYIDSEEIAAVLAVSGNTKFQPLMEACRREVGS